jgi:hypothetical protein
MTRYLQCECRKTARRETVSTSGGNHYCNVKQGSGIWQTRFERFQRRCGSLCSIHRGAHCVLFCVLPEYQNTPNELPRAISFSCELRFGKHNPGLGIYTVYVYEAQNNMFFGFGAQFICGFPTMTKLKEVTPSKSYKVKQVNLSLILIGEEGERRKDTQEGGEGDEHFNYCCFAPWRRRLSRRRLPSSLVLPASAGDGAARATHPHGSPQLSFC